MIFLFGLPEMMIRFLLFRQLKMRVAESFFGSLREIKG